MTIGELAMGRKRSNDSYHDCIVEIMDGLTNDGEWFDGTTTWVVDKMNKDYKLTTLKPVLTDSTIEEVVESMGFIEKRSYND